MLATLETSNINTPGLLDMLTRDASIFAGGLLLEEGEDIADMRSGWSPEDPGSNLMSIILAEMVNTNSMLGEPLTAEQIGELFANTVNIQETCDGGFGWFDEDYEYVDPMNNDPTKEERTFFSELRKYLPKWLSDDKDETNGGGGG